MRAASEMRLAAASTLTFTALLLGAGIILQVIESAYTPPLIIPGAKLGLANSITLLAIALFNWRLVVTHILLRVTVVALVTGTFMSTTFIYSLLGGLAGALAMLVWHKYLYGPFSYAGVSLVGAITHNITQLVLAIFILGTAGVMLFLPWLLLMAVIAGLANGLLVNLVAPRLHLIAGDLSRN